jgi:SagB-type dehydrogenase family enzyme
MPEALAIIALPEPRHEGAMAVERALLRRRSVREFSKAALTLAEASQLLWAAQGITGEDGLRTAPSAGALYPLELYIAAGNVQQLAAGVYKYQPHGHRLTVIAQEDKRRKLAAAALNQNWMQNSAALLIFAGVERRITWKYGQRGIRYMHLEAGHAAQNVFLQALALGLSAAVVGAFDDERVQQVLQMPEDERALYLMPVGRQR